MGTESSATRQELALSLLDILEASGTADHVIRSIVSKPELASEVAELANTQADKHYSLDELYEKVGFLDISDEQSVDLRRAYPDQVKEYLVKITTPIRIHFIRRKLASRWPPATWINGHILDPLGLQGVKIETLLCLQDYLPKQYRNQFLWASGTESSTHVGDGDYDSYHFTLEKGRLRGRFISDNHSYGEDERPDPNFWVLGIETLSKPTP